MFFSVLAPVLLALTESVSAQETAPAEAPANPEIKQVAPGGKTPNEIQTEAGNNQPGSASDKELAADGQNEPESCKSMLDKLAATQSQFIKDRDARRADVAAAAQAHPLVLAMADGDFVYLGGEEKLSEPLESWFVNEEIAEKRETAAQKAPLFSMRRKTPNARLCFSRRWTIKANRLVYRQPSIFTENTAVTPSSVEE